MYRSAFVLLAMAFPAVAMPKALPAWFPNPGIFQPQEMRVADYDDGTFVVAAPKPSDPNHRDNLTVAGRYWFANLKTTREGAAAWKSPEQQLLAAGFRTVFREEKTAREVRATYVRGSGEHATYLAVMLIFPGVGSMHAVEVGPNPLVITLKPPAATPESFTDAQDFPYLTPPPGATLRHTVHFTTPLSFAPAANVPHVPIGSGVVKKEYAADPAMSDLEFHDAYMAALRRAGWTITADTPHGGGTIFAHYDHGGRDLYAFLRGRELSFSVADVGAELKTALQKNCKALLYGINFDVDKATLRADATPILEQVLKVLQDDRSIQLEVGGHTDNTGQPAYNLSLSDRRAAAVREWLVAHGIAPSRLTSHGYGDTQPLVANDNDEHRALNRRVELKKPGCR